MWHFPRGYPFPLPTSVVSVRPNMAFRSAELGSYYEARISRLFSRAFDFSTVFPFVVERFQLPHFIPLSLLACGRVSIALPFAPLHSRNFEEDLFLSPVCRLAHSMTCRLCDCFPSIPPSSQRLWFSPISGSVAKGFGLFPRMCVLTCPLSVSSVLLSVAFSLYWVARRTAPHSVASSFFRRNGAIPKGPSRITVFLWSADLLPPNARTPTFSF